MNKRKSGILMHISSLCGPNGIGDFGYSAYDFVDFLTKANQKIWQILPLGITGYGDSPYQSVSAFAGSPLYIDINVFFDRALIAREAFDFSKLSVDGENVDYQAVKALKLAVIKAAYRAERDQIFNQLRTFHEQEQHWLSDFAAFMTIKSFSDQLPWQAWPEHYRLYSTALVSQIRQRHSEEYWFWVYTQYYFSEQWQMLKKYANLNNIEIMGDIPIYVSADSVDVWAHPQNYLLDENYQMTHVAGCPPDAFALDGQYWGNPLYDWQELAKSDYAWWIDRLIQSFTLYDYVRIDHFKGFESYWEIPAHSETAASGQWQTGPGYHFFECVKAKLGDKKIVAEDLGHMTEQVKQLRQRTGYPGMKILQFAFDSRGDSDYLPHNLEKNAIIYTGTHDNDTVIGWLNTAAEQDVAYAKAYMKLDDQEGFAWGFIRTAWASVCDIAIAQMQDFLALPSTARMNIPSTVGGNWQWRIKEEALNDQLATRIAALTTRYRR